MKKIIATALVLTASALALSSCGSSRIKIAVPNDPTNEARALMLLEKEGLIELKEGATITATIRDIEANPYDIKFEEVEAAQLPNIIDSVDYAVINSNYAIPAKLNPKTDSLAIEGSESPYGNVLAVKEGNENKPLIKALEAALKSQPVIDYINKEYDGSVMPVIDEPFENGLYPELNYDELKGKKITVACSPVPHKDILEVAKTILASKGIELVIKEFDDYIIPNNVVEDGTCDANFFQHLPYLNNFNKQNKTHLVSLGAIHVEPLGVYSVKHESLDFIKSAQK